MCWHKWQVKEKEVLPSLIEQASAANVTRIGYYEDAAHKPCIVTYRCVKCPAEKVERI